MAPLGLPRSVPYLCVVCQDLGDKDSLFENLDVDDNDDNDDDENDDDVPQ